MRPKNKQEATAQITQLLQELGSNVQALLLGFAMEQVNRNREWLQNRILRVERFGAQQPGAEYETATQQITELEERLRRTEKFAALIDAFQYLEMEGSTRDMVEAIREIHGIRAPTKNVTPKTRT